MNIKKGDAVQIIAGKDKGRTGQVIKAIPVDRKIVVENINMVAKHVKPSSAQQKGGIVEQPAAFDSSNAMIICPTCGKATRVAHAVNEGKKNRICKKCGASLDIKARAKTTAKKATKSTAQKAATEKAATEATTATKTATAAKKTTATKKTTVAKKKEPKAESAE